MMIQSWPFYDEDDDENTKDNFDKNFPVENQNWYHWDDQDVENGGLSENKKVGAAAAEKTSLLIAYLSKSTKITTNTEQY